MPPIPGRYRVYYNDSDPKSAAWLRELIKAGLIPPGDVDDAPIQEVPPTRLAKYRSCHFFAGIGGWSYALRLAGWPDDRPVWTGSCPCQPFSSATRGRGKRTESDKHLWPIWRSLIAECTPGVVFGEQVANAGDWFDVVCDDMESMGYQIGAAVLPACSVGFNHVRHRLFFVGDSDGGSKPRCPVYAEAPRVSRDCSVPESVADEDGLPGRVGLLRGYGNAIVPQVAAEFIKAYTQALEAQPPFLGERWGVGSGRWGKGLGESVEDGVETGG